MNILLKMSKNIIFSHPTGNANSGTGIAAFVFELIMAIYIIPHSFKMIGMKWSDVNISNIKLLMNK